MQKWTHDFNFVFTVNTHQSDPDKISPELIVNRFMDTVQNMSREEIFERSECYNSFADELGNEDEPLTIIPCENGVGEWEIHPTGETFDTHKEAEARLSEMLKLDNQKFFDLLWQAFKDTNINFEEVLDTGLLDGVENGVIVKFTGVKNEND